MTESSRAASHRQPELFRLENLLTRRLGADFFAALPAAPGVYFHFDRDGRLLYIGQSSNLKNRVSSYRHVTLGGHARRTVRLVARIHRIEWELCESPAAAVERERVLLLEHKPPFNRAGVWKGEPWWLDGQIGPGALVLSLNRECQGLGSFPPSFRYAFGSMVRCLYRAMAPEVPLHHYPRGLLKGVVPPQIALPFPDPDFAWEQLLELISGKIEYLANAAASWPNPPVSQSDEFWIEEIERVTQYVGKSPFIWVPAEKDTATIKRMPLSLELPLA